MRAACLTLTQIPGATLVKVPLLLTPFEWRRAIQLRLTDVVGVSAFWKWYDRLSFRARCGPHADPPSSRHGRVYPPPSRNRR